MTEKAPVEQGPTRAATDPTRPIDIPTKRNRDELQQSGKSAQSVDAGVGPSKRPREASGKENVAPSSSFRRSSREDITALPISRKLESSPHLRPVDFQPPRIPYNFREYSGSQTSIQPEPQEMMASRPNKLRSRRSAYDSAPGSRRSSKRKDNRLREEEIRAMSAQSPIPKRAGEGILRRDSKKVRGYGTKDSYVSLPAEDDVVSNLTSVLEQRGWEIGSLDIFNPRPAVRLSGTPQYITPSSAATPSPIAEMVRRDKEKMPASRDRKKREAIGDRADDLDASDIRALMERDAKRREKRKKEQQEKLDKKLRSRNGRNRGDSDKRRREAEEVQKAEDEVEQQRRARQLATPPTDIHPAFRNTTAKVAAAGLGLGIGAHEIERAEPEQAEKFETPSEKPQDPFSDDAVASQPATPNTEVIPGAFSPVQTPLETPFIEEARELHMSQTATPPLSPVSQARVPSKLSQMAQARRASEAQLPPPPPITDLRRQSDPKPDRRAGAWATFFRRGGTTSRKGDAQSPPSEASFSNTSRESMRNQPLPAHLVGTQAQQSQMRKAGTPVRTQSRFREDLPEIPLSPPDSRMASPDVSTAAAAYAAATLRARSSAPVTVPEDVSMADAERNDTPISPSMRSRRMVSMASVDSEGSWLASGSPNRHSTQSGVNRSIGSLNKRFSSSYEELGAGDKDAEYFRQMTRKKLGMSQEQAGGATDLESEDEEVTADQPETPGDPIAMHESVRRQPTLVHRDPRVKSREGLLTDYSRAETPDPASPVEPTSAGTGRGSLLGFESDDPEPEIKRASSVDYKRHARQISSGSAKLVGVSPRIATFREEPMPSTSER